MSADILRRAATEIREEWSGGADPMGTAWHRERDFHLAVADWLEGLAIEVGGAFDPDRYADVNPNARKGIAVARAYLGEQS